MTKMVVPCIRAVKWLVWSVKNMSEQSGLHLGLAAGRLPNPNTCDRTMRELGFPVLKTR